MNKESSIAILTNLLQRHEDAAQKYREAEAIVTDRGLKNFLSSLAGYRESLKEEARRWLEDMPPSPIPVSAQVRSYLHKNWDSFREALLQENHSRILEACTKCEAAVSDYYSEALKQEGIPLPVHNDLKEQHKRIMEVRRKVERMEKVPAERKHAF
ncbi:MAG: DUF2383 domain-containing protein [Phaeodactylibacter sp.]|nr:DUF2383 domain-containing protein [Phaeodactylibacter sp.]